MSWTRDGLLLAAKNWESESASISILLMAFETLENPLLRAKLNASVSWVEEVLRKVVFRVGDAGVFEVTVDEWEVGTALDLSLVDGGTAEEAFLLSRAGLVVAIWA